MRVLNFYLINYFVFQIKSGNRMFNFINLNPWGKYSVTICGGLQLLRISVNRAACTCGDDHHIPGGPVFTRTLPEGTVLTIPIAINQ